MAFARHIAIKFSQDSLPTSSVNTHATWTGGTFLADRHFPFPADGSSKVATILKAWSFKCPINGSEHTAGQQQAVMYQRGQEPRLRMDMREGTTLLSVVRLGSLFLLTSLNVLGCRPLRGIMVSAYCLPWKRRKGCSAKS